MSKKSDIAYERVIREESMKEIGLAIFRFRALGQAIEETLDVSPQEIDSAYQAALDKIFDSLIVASDTGLGRAAIDGIRDALDARRGMKKPKAKTTKEK